MAKKRDLLTRARDLPSLCDPECEGRCWECPQTVIDELIAALDAPPVGEPAPMPPEMPQIQVGDVLVGELGSRFTVEIVPPERPWWAVEQIRNGVVVWRRADRKEPS